MKRLLLSVAAVAALGLTLGASRADAQIVYRSYYGPGVYYYGGGYSPYYGRGYFPHPGPYYYGRPFRGYYARPYYYGRPWYGGGVWYGPRRGGVYFRF